MLFLKAAPGRRVKDPDTLQLLAPNGEWKPETSYWHRRLIEEDVIVIEIEQPVTEISPAADDEGAH